jgi:ATP-dependent exoDNAse (exonuclease V) beta subunit
LEQEFIYILHPEKMPLIWNGQQDWELQQEMNPKYVALTRSTHALYFVLDTVSEEEDDQEAVPVEEREPVTTPAQDIAAILTDLEHLQQTVTEFSSRGKLTPRTAQELLNQAAPLRAKLLADKIGEYPRDTIGGIP